MPITVVVNLIAKDGFEGAVAARLEAALPETKKAAGCMELIAYRDQDHPHCFVVLERWESRGDYDAYVSWRRETGSLDAMASRLQEPLRFSFLDVVARS